MTTLSEIAALPLPPFRANIRHLSRKERAAHVRALLKTLKVTGISVPAPNYSMAQSIDIRLPGLEVGDQAHCQRHAEIDNEQATARHAWGGYGTHGCQHCKARMEAKLNIEKVILAAFPDLDNRSRTEEDYFDYCLSIE